MVTAGAQQALTLLGRALTSPTTTVVAGCPSYPGFAAAFLARDRAFVPLAVDDAGVDADAVGRALRRVGASVVYVMPTGHNPTGAVMTSARRRALVEVTASTGTTVIEEMPSRICCSMRASRTTRRWRHTRRTSWQSGPCRS